MPGDQILQAAEFVTQRGALWRLAKDYKAQRHRDAPGSATDCGQRQLRDLREETEGVGGETRGATFPDSQAARRAPAELFWPQWVYRGYNQLGCKGLLHPLMWWGWKVLRALWAFVRCDQPRQSCPSPTTFRKDVFFCYPQGLTGHGYMSVSLLLPRD